MTLFAEFVGHFRTKFTLHIFFYKKIIILSEPQFS